MNELEQLEQLLKRLHSFGLLTNDEEEFYPKALLNIEMQLLEKTDFIKFIQEFNKITGKKYKPDTESRELFYKDASIYSLNDRINAVKNAPKDKYVQDNPGILSPKWILKPEFTAKFMNYGNNKQDLQQSKKGTTGTNKRKPVV